MQVMVKETDGQLTVLEVIKARQVYGSLAFDYIKNTPSGLTFDRVFVHFRNKGIAEENLKRLFHTKELDLSDYIATHN